MKKFFALMLAVLLLASVLTGCAQKTAEAEQPASQTGQTEQPAADSSSASGSFSTGASVSAAGCSVCPV